MALGRFPSQAGPHPTKGEMLAQREEITCSPLWLDTLGLSGDPDEVENKGQV